MGRGAPWTQPTRQTDFTQVLAGCRGSSSDSEGTIRSRQCEVKQENFEVDEEYERRLRVGEMANLSATVPSLRIRKDWRIIFRK